MKDLTKKPEIESFMELLPCVCKKIMEDWGKNMSRYELLEKISALRIDVFEVKEKPTILEKSICPENIIHYAWVPQAVAGRIWVFYEFPSIQERKEWEKKVQLPYGFEIDRDLVSEAEYWDWKIYEPSL